METVLASIAKEINLSQTIVLFVIALIFYFKLKDNFLKALEKTESKLDNKIENFRNELRAEIEKVKAELKADIEKVRNELKADINILTCRLDSLIFSNRDFLREREKYHQSSQNKDEA
jgi:gas vesicle protein